jgi:hypothetical protein
VTALYSKAPSKIYNNADTIKRIPLAQYYAQQSPKQVSIISLSVGDYVMHPVFGEGVVVSCIPTKSDQEAIVNFTGVGVKRLLASLARLEKIEKSPDLT